jgi:predicted RNA-binding Zn-ribbon protein involved in translation (DUF1610 family)
MMNGDVMVEFPKTIRLKCPKCGELISYKLLNVYNDKADYVCKICGNIEKITIEIAVNEQKRKEWNKLSEIYLYLRDAVGKIAFAHSVAKYEVHDEELANILNTIMSEIYRARNEVRGKMKK